MTKPIIVITLGEPGGIGPDICLDIQRLKDCILLLIGDIQILKQRALLLNKAVSFSAVSYEQLISGSIDYAADEILVLHVDCPVLDTVGILCVQNASYVLKVLDIAVDLCQKKIAAAMVTAPVSKEIINKAGYKFSGHTEYLAGKFADSKVVMMLANPLMKVALLTTHVPLNNVAASISRENLRQTLNIIITAFKQYYKIDNPRIGVCGLNPHAGEGGYLGTEEIEIINPEILYWRDLGYNISGAYPADTIFTHLDDFDVVLAMYHDQGLPVLKYADFDNGVNITLGLPILRVSVDHGTALNLAGSSLASSRSLIYAINQARLLMNVS